MDFNTSGTLRSPFSPRVRQSITGRRPLGMGTPRNQSKFMQSSGESGGDIVYKTPAITIETYGTPLPVMVTEALTFASGEVSVRLYPCGWCCVVSGRRAVCWANTVARELTLPQTDLAHKADLVALFYEDGAQMPSCIGVSPEGTVRYWPSVAQEGVYTDVTCELAGQECERLGQHTEDGLVLATTTCTVVILKPTEVDGRATVTWRTLRPPSGWLGGIGRRVSLLFFGSMPAQPDTKLVGVVVLPGVDGGESTVALVSGGPTLQLWRANDLHEHELRRALRDAHGIHGDMNSLELMALDVRASGPDGLLLLIATVNVARSPEMRYAIAHVDVSVAEAVRVSWVCGVRGVPARDPPRLLPLGDRALLYTHSYVAVLNVGPGGAGGAAHVVEVGGAGDRVLGAELCGPVPLLFSAKHGVLALACHAHPAHLAHPAHAAQRDDSPLCDSPMGSPCPSDMYDGNLSLYEIDPHEMSLVSRDACGKLKTAFLFHVRREAGACAAILRTLFPAQAQADVDAPLDATVLRIATDMLDDVPAGDPRWKQRSGTVSNISLGSSSALEVAAQLRDKQRAFALFLDFLRSVGLWQRLGEVTLECGSVVRTESALMSLGASLALAQALRRMQHGPDAPLIDAAIQQVVCSEDASEEPEVEEALASGALSATDVCYRRVSRVTRVLRALAAAPAPAHDARAAAAHAAATLAVLANALRAELSARTTDVSPARSERRTLWNALRDLHKRAILEYAHNCPEASVRGALLEAAGALADALLTDARELSAPHTQHLYEDMRRDLIRPFLDEGQSERAAALAEKFKDFELLIEMCVESDQLDRLYGYLDKYKDEGICEIAFAWLAQRGGAGQALLLRTARPALAPALRAWLRRAPARRPLLALHELGAARHAHAARALLDLASDETHSVERMTTMASLGKLCAAASPDRDGDTWAALGARLALGEQHAALPRAVRYRYGLSDADCRVLPAEELVQMYVESESSELTEYDYKKALDLTDFIQDMELRDDLRLKVWCASVRRDDWTSCRVEAPADELQRKTFFRLVDLVHVMGGDIELLLPPVDDILTAPELAELLDTRAHFVLKYGYQCLAGRLQEA